MFSVYSVSGRVTSGTLEQLRDVAAVNPSARIRPITGQGLSGKRALTDEDFVHLSGGHPGGPSASAQAMVAYANTQAGGLPRHRLEWVGDVMSAEVMTLRDDAPVAEAWEALAERGHAQAPVLNAQGVLVGMLLRVDLIKPSTLPHPANSPAEWLAVWRKTVAELMVTPVPSVSAGTELRRVAQALLDWQLPGLPVADDAGSVIGFVSRGDILRGVAADPPLDLWG